VVLFDTQRPEWQPLINPVANLVYSATGDSVRDVFVAGEHVVADGSLTRIDESKLYEQVPVAVMRFSKRLKVDQMVQLRWPVT
jgi:cytosine/adenosine deaminase-related metal-dependent hydrolase